MPSYRTPDTRNIKRVNGEFLYRRITAGVLEPQWQSTGLVLTGNLQHNITKESLPNRLTAAGGKYVEDVTEKEGTLTLRCTEHQSDVVKMALLGDTTTVALQTSASGATSDVPAAEGIHEIPAKHITVTGVAQGATPLVLGTDYEVLDAELGLVRLIAGGALTVGGADVTFTYDRAAVDARTKIRGYTQTAIEIQALFIDRSARGPRQHVRFFRLGVEPGQFDLLAEGYSQFDIVLNMLDDSAGAFGGSAASPFYEVEEHPVVTVP